ncbi:hypothetical protein BDQ12DRAFT_623122 [Crucibulum laeve]|uniref:Uncharacterized protein n=1 Tax=Crucibulum laeve TaxID=68775 RepID=A0A5C3MJ21_9AGAR|nr:hypothetical protein BDQ12DRAFT_623122 [Crucibulum laeve]
MAAINEPFLLSSYASTTKAQKSKTESKRPANVYATYQKASSSSDGYVTVAAQADGVHVVDVSTLHPVISHTLGPSSRFSCPAITTISSSNAAQTCTTYCVPSAASDIPTSEAGRTIWAWTEDLSSSLADRARQTKKVAVIPHPIEGLYTTGELPDRLAILSPKGDVTVVDEQLAIKVSRNSEEGQDILKAYVLERSTCTFLETRNPGMLLGLVSDAAAKVKLQILTVAEDVIEQVGECDVPISKDQISCTSISSSGCFSVLTRDGTWHCYTLAFLDAKLELKSFSPEFTLTALSPFSKPKSPQSQSISLLALTSSHVLLASPTSPSPSSQQEIALLLWDLQYSVLLASHLLPIPSSLKEAQIELELVPAGVGQALLVLSPADDKGKEQAMSSVLAIPCTVPPMSTIAGALGKANVGARWVKDASAPGAAPEEKYDSERRKVVEGIRKAMDGGRLPLVKEVFFNWEQKEAQRVKEQREKKEKERKKAEKEKAKQNAMDVEEEGSEEAEEGSAEKADQVAESVEQEEREEPTHPELGYVFVKDVLNAVLQPSKPANTPYSTEVLAYLLERKAVGNGMLEGGLIGVLRAKGDWKSIELALRNVLDITEVELVDCLRIVIRKHLLRAAASDPTSMDVDSTPKGATQEILSLPSFLALCITYPTSLPPLRVALRSLLAEELTLLIEVSERWVTRWVDRGMKLLPSEKEVQKNEHGVMVLGDPKKDKKVKESNEELPPLDKVTIFLQTLLDSSFLTLLQYPLSHPILKRIQAQLQPEIAYLDVIESLRGPLEPFAIAQAKAVREATREKKKGPSQDWRQKKKLAHQQQQIVGVYQLEELVI